MIEAGLQVGLRPRFDLRSFAEDPSITDAIRSEAPAGQVELEWPWITFAMRAQVQAGQHTDVEIVFWQRGGKFTSSRRIWPSVTAWRCSQRPSTAQFERYFEASIDGHAASTKSIRLLSSRRASSSSNRPDAA